ncbi:adenosylmethionine--8-amino-7-oxononanoate transaminase [Synechococcus sp. PCC 6312]|uniref:adenosylmethionine--8-amino-7-oxononanoate transaminase n=1 Tax=Synechococcus sp. (strain ATCC 27167 / PCC 6312) TaxID=195253 RepID=UPI00029F3800|nr:adenosylmethionine--8-amino-7-oxononanoate transaminase [Synechococcus sp. PCC 6312]AFY60037.1 adenosylmethionine-8-amino-7-oxononanoate transaminase [Synechococcus sp. PCC 6312]
MIDASILTIDNSPIWRPFTQMKTADAPLLVKKGDGMTLELGDGRQILDCISSWWVTIHGHSHPVLAQALAEQAQQLEQVIFTAFTHEPAETLAQKLLDHLPQHLRRVFFSDNGSTAVEVALKMAYQYWQRLGEPQRTRFLGFTGGYHGDTLGAMAMGQSSPWWHPFQPLLMSLETIPFPATFDHDPEVSTKENQALEILSQRLTAHPQEYAAIFIEPLVQGAGGMRMCRPEFLQRLQALVHEFHVLLVYDEVMTGFGRTGELFATLKSATQPDLICLSKGLSGGCLPLAVTVATEAIYQAFYDDALEKAFFHSHSYTGNPLACATGVASLKLLEHQPQIYQRLESLHRQLAAHYLQEQPGVEKLRFCGTIMAFDLKTNTQEDYFSDLGPWLRQEFLAAGLLLRPLGKTIYLLPPYCVTELELEKIYQTLPQVLAKLAKLHSLIPT